MQSVEAQNGARRPPRATSSPPSSGPTILHMGKMAELKAVALVSAMESPLYMSPSEANRGI
eukprot:SAG25_NODE_9963_length_350_cov_1.215139_2_plen_60_part_01